LNSRPSVPQIDAPQTADLHKHQETASGLPFWLITGSRWFAMSRDLYAACRKGLVEDHSGGFRIEPTWRSMNGHHPGRIACLAT